MSEEWDVIVKDLKYESEAAMWQDLYITKGWSIKRIADVLGFSTSAINRRIGRVGITLRSRGGRRNVGGEARLKLLRMDPRWAIYGPMTEVARIAHLNTSTVWHFRKWANSNGEEMYAGQSNNSDQSAGDVCSTK